MFNNFIVPETRQALFRLKLPLVSEATLQIFIFQQWNRNIVLH